MKLQIQHSTEISPWNYFYIQKMEILANLLLVGVCVKLLLSFRLLFKMHVLFWLFNSHIFS